MPNFNSNKALEVRNSYDKKLPFYIVSEQINKEELDRAFLQGCDGFISKENLPQIRSLADKLFSHI